jgi:hypothetical protein
VKILIKNSNAHERVKEHRAPPFLVRAQFAFELSEILEQDAAHDYGDGWGPRSSGLDIYIPLISVQMNS